jgi:DtxR family transcriptional regulator, Mn-dependent transcriptional regulator
MPQLTESTEEYLEAIYKLSRDSTVTVGRLATALEVSPPSVSQMVGRLEHAGLVERDASSGIGLTPEGLVAALRLVRRHRLSERFLADYLDLPWDQVHEEACKFEHVLSEEVEERLAAQLGNPRTCPHGHVIPDEDGLALDEPAVPLTDLGEGAATTIVRISDERPDLLRYLASLGLLPQTQIRVEGVAPFGGPYLVRVREAQYALGREVAGKIFVRA